MGRPRKLPAGVTARTNNDGTTSYVVRYRDPDGRHRKQTFRDPDEAIRHKRAVDRDIETNQYVAPENGLVPFAEIAAAWEATRVHLRPNTRDRDERLMRKHVVPVLGDRPVGRISRADVQAAVSAWTADGLAPNTVTKCYELVAAVYEHALEDGLVAATPCRKITVPKTTNSLAARRMPTEDEIDAIADAIERRYRALVYVAAYTGLRWGEAVGLRRRYVNMPARSIDVVEQLGETGGKVMVGAPLKTNASAGTVRFPGWVADEIAQHLLAYADPDKERALVFVGEDGAPLRRSNFARRKWQPALERADVPLMPFHVLRHFHASWLIGPADYKLHEVQRQLRHSRASITSDTYAHLFGDGIDIARMDAAAEKRRNKRDAR